ncbi:MAG: hypothetical protein HQK54_16245 [Oligoflexales bacterium]|nr:hypothetical protein [Oligoflexales bacterium]
MWNKAKTKESDFFGCHIHIFMVLLAIIYGCSSKKSDNLGLSSNDQSKKSENESKPPQENPNTDPDTAPELLKQRDKDNALTTKTNLKPNEMFLALSTLPETKKEGFWIIPTDFTATFYNLDGKKITSKKKWNYLKGEGGTRILVLDEGVIFAKNGGHIYWINQAETKEGALNEADGSPNYFRLPNAEDGDRACLADYVKDGKKHIGIGYGKGNFVEIRQKDDFPYDPIFKVVSQTKVDSTDQPWGFSCYMDRKNLIFYSIGQLDTSVLRALDIKNQKAVMPSQAAPNGNFKSDNLVDESLGPKSEFKGSYIISGDDQGNVFSGKNYYVMVDDGFGNIYSPRTSSTGASLNIFRKECLTSTGTCPSDSIGGFFLKEQISAGIGPISPLSYGGMIAVSRNSGEIYMLNPKDVKSVKAGFSIDNIGKADADPDLYGRFTQIPLKNRNGLKLTFDLTKAEHFSDKSVMSALTVDWLPTEGQSKKSSGLEIEARCYTASSENEQFVPLTGVEDSGTRTKITVPSCSGKFYEKVDIALIQIPGSGRVLSVKEININLETSAEAPKQ